ncbi:MAG: FadR family transcriptional regulator [Syntrophobacterales bacterium]|nr:MAG: FadR family transcriptional regulator [Syntrophobacterales bacterium]
MVVKPIQRSSAAAKVFETLYEMIATGQFQRGQKLPSQDDLAKQFGVSRNTLREAINKLSAMGLLSSHQGIGTVVESPHPAGYLSALSGQFLLDPLSVREFIEARICIERNAVRLAVAHAKPEDLTRLRNNLMLQDRALKNQDTAEFTRQDADFHLELARICGNRVLLKFLQTIHDMLQRFIGEVSGLPGAVDDALRFHTRIADAIAAKDPDQAEQLVVRHLFDVVRRIESNLHIDLEKESLCGFKLIRSIPGATGARRSRKT